MTDIRLDAKNEKQSKTSEEARTSQWLWLRRIPAVLDPLIQLFDPAKKLIRPYIKKAQVVADLGCGWGYYSFFLADIVEPDGKVYSVDIDGKCIRMIQKKAEKRGYHNIETHASTAADLSYIPDGSVDFVFENGLLCSMATDRPLAVNEMRRILKPIGMAYLTGGLPPLGYVDQAEWEEILSGFKVEKGGGLKEMWALVSLK